MLFKLLLVSFLFSNCKKDDTTSRVYGASGKGTIVYKGKTYNWDEDVVKFFTISPLTGGGFNHILFVNINELQLDIRYWELITKAGTVNISACNADPIIGACRNSISFADKMHTNLVAFYSGKYTLPSTLSISAYSNNKATGSFSIRVEETTNVYALYPTFYNQFETITGTFNDLKTN